jgi:hypothetical protein
MSILFEELLCRTSLGETCFAVEVRGNVFLLCLLVLEKRFLRHPKPQPTFYASTVLLWTGIEAGSAGLCKSYMESRRKYSTKGETNIYAPLFIASQSNVSMSTWKRSSHKT